MPRKSVARPDPKEDPILTLHSAINREDLWLGIRDLLRAHFNLSRVSLFLGHLGMGEARQVFTDPPIENADAWFDARGKSNPFSPWIARHIGAPYYDFAEVVGSPAAFRETEFYRCFARHEGWDKGFSVMFWEGESMRAMFSVYRSLHQKPFTPAEKARMIALTRHIEIAITRVQKIDREESFRAAIQDFTRTVPAPLLLLDWEPKLVFANLAAYESAAVWNFGAAHSRTINPRECLRIPAPIHNAVDLLKRQIEALSPKSLARQKPPPVTVVNRNDPRLRARVNPALHGRRSISRPGFFVLFEEPFALQDEDEPAIKESRRQRALQTLTPSERKVAGLVCEGRRNAEIARLLNKSVLTVKTQMNSIFQKLDLESRGQLIARLK